MDAGLRVPDDRQRPPALPGDGGEGHAGRSGARQPMGGVRTARAPPLDADQQVMQDEEIARLTTFARTGNPTAKGFATWPEFNHSGDEMELAARR